MNEDEFREALNKKIEEGKDHLTAINEILDQGLSEQEGVAKEASDLMDKIMDFCNKLTKEIAESGSDEAKHLLIAFPAGIMASFASRFQEDKTLTYLIDVYSRALEITRTYCALEKLQKAIKSKEEKK